MNTSRQRLNRAVSSFYHNPVATVSAELLVTIAFTIFLAIVAIQPTLATMAKLSAEIKEKSELNDKLDKKIAALNTAQSEYNRWEEQLALLGEAIPNSGAIITDLKVLERLASENSVVINSLALSEYPDEATTQVNQGKVNNIPLTLSLVGDYRSIRAYIDALLNYRRIFVVNSVIFGISRERSGTDSLNASLSINMPLYQ